MVVNRALSGLELGGYLYEVLDDAASDASGATRVMITPNLRQAALTGDLVNFDHPTSPMQVQQQDGASIERRAANIGAVAFAFVEKLPT